jgi:four helix bundle protein
MALIRFEELEVFKRAYRISLEIHRASLEFPTLEQYALGDQIRRCSKGICANIAEGFGKSSQSKAELKRFLSMAVGSADEIRVWLRYCLDLGYLSESQWQAWRDEYEESARMLQGLRKSVN